MQYTVLLVDDDPLSLTSTASFLEFNSFAVDKATTGEEAVSSLRNAPDKYALVILDYKLKEETGARTAQELLKINPHLYILMYSGEGSTEAVRSTFKAGAVDFIEKGASKESFLATVKSYCRKYEETSKTVQPLKIETENEQIIASIDMVGRSAALVDVAKKVHRFKHDNDKTVLILGETGTGKELVAKALHTGPEAKFFAINCAMFQGKGELLESELFGYEKGAFTGAIQRKIGMLELAAGGTVFLDEIHHLSLESQAKLLRALNDKRIRRLGGGQEYSVNFRLIAAAKPELEAMADNGQFAPDLYYRLRVLRITIPPLRERIVDIEPLVSLFTERYNKKTGQNKRFLIKTLRYLEQYKWSGNVRDLEGMVNELLINCDADRIEPLHLEAKYFSTVSAKAVLSYDEFKEIQERREREYLTSILSSSSTKLDAANKMGISPTTLQSKLIRYGLHKTLRG